MSYTMSSNKPYVVRAFYEWISDNQLTPYIQVDVNVVGVSVPMAYVHDGQIVLNISMSAVGSISMVGDEIMFSARFGGRLEHLRVPYGAIAAIYAKENGAGTALPIEHPAEFEKSSEQPSKSGLASVETTSSEQQDDQKPPVATKKGKPSLTVIK
jgi:stringent starvation protein B